MRTRTTLAALLTAGALLTACSSGSDGKTNSQPKPAGAKADGTFNCSDPNLSQADRTANCSGPAAGTPAKQFRQTYTWPDGVKATVTEARVFTAYDKSLDEKADPGSTDYQVMIKITNGGRVPVDLGGISVITAGATNGGAASMTSWANAAPGLEGRLAPGVTVTKGDAESLETKFGRKIVVTLQRMSATGDPMAFPEFTGTITG